MQRGLARVVVGACEVAGGDEQRPTGRAGSEDLIPLTLLLRLPDESRLRISSLAHTAHGHWLSGKLSFPRSTVKEVAYPGGLIWHGSQCDVCGILCALSFVRTCTCVVALL